MAGLRRFFIEGNISVGANIDISGEEYNHAVNILRVRVGEQIILCNDSNIEYISTITAIAKKYITVNVIEERQNNCVPKENITLICGYLKGDKTELVCQKAVELGVSNIVLFDSKYSSSYFSDNKLARLKKVIVESSKQCGRSELCKISYFNSLEKALDAGDNCQSKIFACEFKTGNSVKLDDVFGSTAIVVGSEGGFTEQEEECAFAKGYKTVSLGNRILRAETASIALVAIVSYKLNELQ